VQRGELYLVRKPGAHDARKRRVFVVVSRQLVIDSKFSTVICAPVYSRHDGLSTQVRLGTEHGLKHQSSIHCDELVSLPKTMLTRCVGRLDQAQTQNLDFALQVALALDQSI
jgi:mRNA interferase MazF